MAKKLLNMWSTMGLRGWAFIESLSKCLGTIRGPLHCTNLCESYCCRHIDCDADVKAEGLLSRAGKGISTGSMGNGLTILIWACWIKNMQR